VVIAVPTVVLDDPLDVDRRLEELKLNRGKLLKVVAAAMSDAANATPFHCANAPGTFAYQTAVWALRNEFVGADWKLDRSHGVEGIWNAAIKTRVMFSNVDICCDINQQPKPRSKKGAGSERACGGNLFGDLPHYAPQPKGDIAAFYLLSDENGTAELVRPVITGDTFSAYVERIFLFSSVDDFDNRFSLDNDDAIDQFDPKIVRK
jgi:hypothetical protein